MIVFNFQDFQRRQNIWKIVVKNVSFFAIFYSVIVFLDFEQSDNQMILRFPKAFFYPVKYHLHSDWYKILSLLFLIRDTQKFGCLVDINLISSVLNFKYLLRSCVDFVIALEMALHDFLTLFFLWTACLFFASMCLYDITKFTK